MRDSGLTSPYPTAARRLSALCSPEREIWVKDDGATDPEYGGNKVRKLERIVPHAVTRGARRLVTFGAVGSHHVLTTAIFARRHGLDAAAVLIAQPRTEHALQTLQAALGQGLVAYPATHSLLVPIVLARTLRKHDYVIAPGGSNLLGTLAYVDAVRELREQVRAGELPEPDRIVVALGSGGTASGLLAGVFAEKLRSRVVAVDVVGNPLARVLVIQAAARALRHLGQPFSLSELNARLEIVASELGGGYGHASVSGARARRRAEDLGIILDPTYTAKAFADVLSRCDMSAEAPETILYWHTLSSAPLTKLLEGAPSAAEIAPALQQLFATGVRDSI